MTRPNNLFRFAIDRRRIYECGLIGEALVHDLSSGQELGLGLDVERSPSADSDSGYLHAT